MILILHITMALLSIIATSYLYFRPSTRALHASYTLVGATLASGTYLVLSLHTSLIAACTSGLVYLAIVAVGIASGRRKLSFDQ